MKAHMEETTKVVFYISAHWTFSYNNESRDNFDGRMQVG